MWAYSFLREGYYSFEQHGEEKDLGDFVALGGEVGDENIFLKINLSPLTFPTALGNSRSDAENVIQAATPFPKVNGFFCALFWAIKVSIAGRGRNTIPSRGISPQLLRLFSAPGILFV